MRYDLTGKSIVVTGATSGIGLAGIKALVAAGAFVIGVGRNEQRNTKAEEHIRSEIPHARLGYVLADLAQQSQILEAVKAIAMLLEENGFSHLDGLINNAGVYLEKKNITKDGVEMTFAVNHLAAFLFTMKLMPLLRESVQGRVLTVSSYSHFTTPLNLKRISNPRPYVGLLAYKRSKLCNVLFVYEFNRRYPELRAFAVDPGLVNTSIASKSGHGISHLVWKNRRHKGDPPELAAQTLLFLIAAPNVDMSQDYYFKNCGNKEPSKKSRREDLAAELWDLSLELTGLK